MVLVIHANGCATYSAVQHWQREMAVYAMDGVSNHRHFDYLLNRLFRRRSKKTSKLRVTGLSAGNSPGTDEFPAQRASNAENISIWWRHHVNVYLGSFRMKVERFIEITYQSVFVAQIQTACFHWSVIPLYTPLNKGKCINIKEQIHK